MKNISSAQNNQAFNSTFRNNRQTNQFEPVQHLISFARNQNVLDRELTNALLEFKNKYQHVAPSDSVLSRILGLSRQKVNYRTRKDNPLFTKHKQRGFNAACYYSFNKLLERPDVCRKLAPYYPALRQRGGGDTILYAKGERLLFKRGGQNFFGSESLILGRQAAAAIIKSHCLHEQWNERRTIFEKPIACECAKKRKDSMKPISEYQFSPLMNRVARKFGITPEGLVELSAFPDECLSIAAERAARVSPSHAYNYIYRAAAGIAEDLKMNTDQATVAGIKYRYMVDGSAPKVIANYEAPEDVTNLRTSGEFLKGEGHVDFMKAKTTRRAAWVNTYRTNKNYDRINEGLALIAKLRAMDALEAQARMVVSEAFAIHRTLIDEWPSDLLTLFKNNSLSFQQAVAYLEHLNQNKIVSEKSPHTKAQQSVLEDIKKAGYSGTPEEILKMTYYGSMLMHDKLQIQELQRRIRQEFPNMVTS